MHWYEFTVNYPDINWYVDIECLIKKSHMIQEALMSA